MFSLLIKLTLVQETIDSVFGKAPFHNASRFPVALRTRLSGNSVLAGGTLFRDGDTNGVYMFHVEFYIMIYKLSIFKIKILCIMEYFSLENTEFVLFFIFSNEKFTFCKLDSFHKTC